MDPIAWGQVALVCALGAISPGPSLAVVLRNTLRGGKRTGVLTGVGHGLGILFYSGLVVTGLAVALAAAPRVEEALTWAGIALLVVLGVMFAGLWPRRAAPAPAAAEAPASAPGRGRNGFAAGFLIAFLNPKIAAFFLAVFSPFIRADAGSLEKAILAVTAGTIDTGWYVLVACVLSGTGLIGLLQRHAGRIERGIGALLLIIAAGLIVRAV